MKANALPFYDKPQLQNFRKRWCENDRRITLSCIGTDNGTGAIEALFMPFQIVTDAIEIDNVFLRTEQFENPVEYSFSPVDFNFTSAQTLANGKNLICYQGDPVTFNQNGSALHEFFEDKDWYFEIVAGGEKYYSEQFRMLHSVSNYPCGDWVQINYRSEKNLANINFELVPEYIERLWIGADVGRPTYNYKVDGEEDGTGKFFALSRRVEKTFEFEFFANEPMCDALAVMPLCNSITFLTANESFEARDVKFEVKEWDLALAKCVISFHTDFAATVGSC